MAKQQKIGEKKIKVRVLKNSKVFIKYTSRPKCINCKALKTIQLQFMKRKYH